MSFISNIKHLCYSLFIGILSIFLLSSFTHKDTQILDSIFQEIDIHMSKIKTLQFKLKRTERIEGELISVENYIRFQAQPFKSMIEFLGESEGDFLLYVPSEYEGKAVFIPGGFPYVNVNLSPQSSLMRKTSHYTVEEIGVQFIVDQIKGNYLKWKEYFHYRGKFFGENGHYHLIEGVLDKLEYFEYEVKPGETLGDIGKKFYVSEYMLMEINDNVDALDDDMEGQIINIPNCYANRIVMHVNEATLFPEMILIEDSSGIFEKYEYREIKINEQIDPNFFNEEYLDDL